MAVAWPHFARATTPSRVVVDVMPACATGWRKAGPISQPSVGLRYDVAVTADAVLVVRSANGRCMAVLRKDERRAWMCMPPPEPVPNT